MGLSEELFDRAVKVIPGGVNSPVPVSYTHLTLPTNSLV